MTDLAEIVNDLVAAGYTEPPSLVDLTRRAEELLARSEPVPVPLVLIHVDGGIAEEWYTVRGYGMPEIHILDFDREGETDEEQATFIAIARDALALFKARGVDTSDLDADLDEMEAYAKA